MTSHTEPNQTERLLEQIRVRIAELRHLERTRTDQSALRRRRREISELQWRLARFVSQEPSGGDQRADARRARARANRSSRGTQTPQR
jgi:hypothetical protein